MSFFKKANEQTAGEIAHKAELKAKERMVKPIEHVLEIRQGYRKAEAAIVRAQELAIEKDEAMIAAARSVTALCNMAINNLPAIVEGIAKAQGMNAVMAGLVSRNGLDARRLKQDSLEVTSLVQLMTEMFKEKLSAGGGSAKRDIDPELKDAEREFREAEEKAKNNG